MSSGEGLEGLGTTLTMLDGLKAEIIEAAAAGLRKGLKRTVKEAKALCTVDTGGLRNSITDIVTVEGNTVDGQVVATAEHAVYVEMGTGPVGEANHAGIASVPVTYSPKGWTYKDPKTGEFIHTRGQAAQPYMYPAYKLTKDLVVQDVKVAINNR